MVFSCDVIESGGLGDVKEGHDTREMGKIFRVCTKVLNGWIIIL